MRTTTPRPGRSYVVLLAAGAALALLCSSLPAGAADRTSRPPAPAVLEARARLASSIGPGTILQTNAYLGTLRWMANLDGFLTGPSGQSPQDVAMGFMRDHLDAFGLTASDLDLLVFRDDYVDILGTHHLTWVQELNGQPLFAAGLKAAVAADGSLETLAGPVYHVVNPEAVPRTRPTLTKDQALVAARRAAGGVARRSLRIPGPRDRASLVRFPTAGTPRLAWDTTTTISPLRVLRSVVDARTGRVLWRENLVHRDLTGSGLAWPNAPGPFPNGGGDQRPVTFPVAGPDALSGNNAHVYTAIPGDSEVHPEDEVPALDAAALDWSKPAVLDTTTAAQNCSPTIPCTWNAGVPFSWQTNRVQGAVQAYYLLNIYHDHLAAAPIGFTEAAGNFQLVNHDGQGGLDGDPVNADTLVAANLTGDGRPGLLNNATMYTPPDGRAGWLSLYLFGRTRSNPSLPSADSADDATVIFHEYTHGLTSRLVTMPDGSEALYGQQSGALTEGWSDWYALDALVNEGFQADTAAVDLPVAPWVSGGEGSRFQYADCLVSTRVAGCPETPGGSGPGGLTYADFGRVLTRPEVHSDGEIWLQTLWQIRSELGSTVTESLVTRAMELSPQAPTFLDMRNAILAADAVIFGGSHQSTLWQVFAERGMGFFASTADTFDTRPHADFSVPVTCPGPGCGTLSGRIVDPTDGGAPVPGATVHIAGAQEGIPVDLSAVTGADGTYTIADVPEATYHHVQVSLDGYATRTFHRVRVGAASELSLKLRRDWSSVAGGAVITGFTGPDHTGISGECGPAGLVDGSRSTSWLTSLDRPQSVTIQLPRRIHVTGFAVDPSAICAGSYSDAKGFDIWTRREGGPWILAYRTRSQLPPHRLSTVRPGAGRWGVRYVRLVLHSAAHSRRQVEFTELMVRGRAAA